MKQMKGFVCGIIFAVCLMATPALADSVEKLIDVLTDYVIVEIDGETKDVRNFVHEGTTYIALRDVAELLGCTVDWNDATHTASISTGKAPAPQEKVAIEVNGEKITEAQFAEMYASVDSYYGTKMTTEDKIAFVKEELVTQAVASAKAKEFNVGDGEEARKAAEAELSALDTAYGSSMVDQILSAQGYTRQSYIEYVVNSTVNSALLEYMEQNLEGYAALKDDAKSYYEANKEQYKEHSVQVKHILIPTDGQNEETVKAEVDKIASQVTKDTFDMILLTYNNDPGQPAEGYTVNGNGTFVPEFEEAALALTEPGQISAPVKTSYGYHILMATAINEYTPYETFLSSYLQDAYSKLDMEYLKKWIEEANVVYNDDVINALVK